MVSKSYELIQELCSLKQLVLKKEKEIAKAEWKERVEAYGKLAEKAHGLFCWISGCTWKTEDWSGNHREYWIKKVRDVLTDSYRNLDQEKLEKLLDRLSAHKKDAEKSGIALMGLIADFRDIGRYR